MAGMVPPIGLLTPIKAGLGGWLSDFYAQFYPDTPANIEWAKRGTSKAMAWAPGRMVDAVEEMLSAWKNNDNSGKAGTSAYLPVLFAAVANEYAETPNEDGRPITDAMPFSFPQDPQHRQFMIRLMSGDLRAQVAVIAAEPLSAMSIIGQLCLWASGRMAFPCVYRFAGFDTPWTSRIVGTERMAISSPVGDQLTILTLDLTIRAAIPLYYGNGNGSGGIGDPLNPAGFPVVTKVTNQWDQKMTPLGVATSQNALGVVLHGIVGRAGAA